MCLKRHSHIFYQHSSASLDAKRQQKQKETEKKKNIEIMLRCVALYIEW